MKIVFTNEELLSLIFDALCNGLSSLQMSGIFINVDKDTYTKHRQHGDCIEDVYRRILERGGSLSFKDEEGDEDASFTLVEAKQRLEALTENLDVILTMKNENGDGWDAANFLQLCLYSKIVFG